MLKTSPPEATIMRDVYILDAVRTPRGRGKAGKGALSGVHPQELLAQALNHLAKKTAFKREDVADVVIGCVTQANEQGACIARNTILAAGWPDDVTGVTLNRFCGSGSAASRACRAARWAATARCSTATT
jgi:acetyl-CoA C-acetyltransferase